MKNLKRALTLVLACAMIFGMFAINASAATTSFTDNDTIVNSEAVATMTQLNIIKGYEDGSFKPTQVVTRAEMCKMICIALNGGVEPVLGADSLAIFSDTQGHWANPYISYCFSEGIVSGDSGKGGTFRPEATVTGTEAAKMMLVAMGYKSAYAGFTGADWALKVGAAANSKGLFTGLATLNVSTGLTRDNAAQLIYNGIKAEMVEYDSTLATDPVTGQLTSSPKLKTLSGKTMLTEKFGVSVLEGIVMSSEYATVTGSDATNVKGETTMFVKTDDGTAVNANRTLKTSTPADMVGMSVKVYVKDNSLSGTYYSTVFGTPVLTANNKTKTFTGAKYSTLSDFTKAMKDAGLTGYEAASAAPTGVIVTTNYGNTVDNATYYNAGTTMTDTAANNLLGRGKQVTFIDNDNDGLVDYVKVVAKYVGQVTVLNSAGNSGNGAITVTTKNGSANPTNALSAKAFDKVYGEENVAKDDYVLFYELNGYYYVEKAESTTADVSGIKPNASTPSSGSVTAGDKTYNQSALVTNVDATNVLSDAVTLGKSTVFFFDNYGYVIYVKAAAATSNYCVVTAVGTPDNLNGLSVRIVNEEGVTSVVSLDSITTAAGNKISTCNSDGLPGTAGTDIEDTLSGQHTGGVAYRASAASTVFTYTVKENGKYALTVPTTGTTGTGTTSVTTNNPTLGGSGDIANSSTIFVVKTGTNTYTKYVGIAAVPSVTAATSLTYTKPSASGVTIAFFTAGTVNSSSTSGVFICSTSYTSVLDGTTTVYQYPAIVNGEAKTITADATNIFTSVAYYDTGISLNSKGYYTAATATYTLVPVTTVGSGVINGFTYDDSTKVFEISAIGKVTESAMGNIYDGTNGSIANNVVIVPKATTGIDSTVAKYVFVRGEASAPAPTAASATVTGTGVIGALTANGTTTATTACVAGDTFVLAVTPGAGATISIALTSGIAANWNAATNTYSITASDLAAGASNITFTVTSTMAGRNATTTTYTIDIA